MSRVYGNIKKVMKILKEEWMEFTELEKEFYCFNYEVRLIQGGLK